MLVVGKLFQCLRYLKASTSRLPHFYCMIHYKIYLVIHCWSCSRLVSNWRKPTCLKACRVGPACSSESKNIWMGNRLVAGVPSGRLARSHQTPAWSRNCQWPPWSCGEAGPRKLSRKEVSWARVRRLGLCWRYRITEWLPADLNRVERNVSVN